MPSLASKTRTSAEGAARIVHEAHRAYQNILNDPYPNQPWDALDDFARDTVISRVELIRDGWTPGMVQEAWVSRMEQAGWSWGTVKDPFRKTHPELLAWDCCSPESKRKVLMAFRLVYVLDFE